MSTKTEKRRAAREKKAKAGAAMDRVANDDQVSSFARQHGNYVREGNSAAVNRSGTPLARWTRDGLLSETQLLAIQCCLRLRERAGRFTGLVQDLLKIPGQQPSSGMAQQDALDELVRFKEAVPRKYWEVFENVCRFDEPARVAGSALSHTTRSAQEAAVICVCFVADIIAMRRRLDQ
jgi:hypothetical protein